MSVFDVFKGKCGTSTLNGSILWRYGTPLLSNELERIAGGVSEPGPFYQVKMEVDPHDPLRILVYPFSCYVRDLNNEDFGSVLVCLSFNKKQHENYAFAFKVDSLGYGKYYIGLTYRRVPAHIDKFLINIIAVKDSDFDSLNPALEVRNPVRYVYKNDLCILGELQIQVTGAVIQDYKPRSQKFLGTPIYGPEIDGEGNEVPDYSRVLLPEGKQIIRADWLFNNSFYLPDFNDLVPSSQEGGDKALAMGQLASVLEKDRERAGEDSTKYKRFVDGLYFGWVVCKAAWEAKTFKGGLNG